MMDQKKLDVNDTRWRTDHEYHECEGDTLKPRRLRVYPDNQVDCKQPWRFVLGQLLGRHPKLPDTKNQG